MKYKIFSSIWEKWILSNFLLLFLQPLRTITRFTTLLLQNIARPKSESKSNFIPNHHLLLVISSISSQKSFDSPYYKLRKSFNSSLPPLSHANFLNYIPYIKSKFILWHHWSKWLNPFIIRTNEKVSNNKNPIFRIINLQQISGQKEKTYNRSLTKKVANSFQISNPSNQFMKLRTCN